MFTEKTWKCAQLSAVTCIPYSGMHISLMALLEGDLTQILKLRQSTCIYIPYRVTGDKETVGLTAYYNAVIVCFHKCRCQ